MVYFLEKLANLCNGGLLLADALESISKNSSSEKENLLSCQILEKLRDGNNLAQALKKCCNFFDDSMLSVLELGDLTGKLSHALVNIVTSLRREIETKKRFITGLSYPIFNLNILLPIISSHDKTVTSFLAKICIASLRESASTFPCTVVRFPSKPLYLNFIGAIVANLCPSDKKLLFAGHFIHAQTVAVLLQKRF